MKKDLFWLMLSEVVSWGQLVSWLEVRYLTIILHIFCTQEMHVFQCICYFFLISDEIDGVGFSRVCSNRAYSFEPFKEQTFISYTSFYFSPNHKPILLKLSCAGWGWIRTHEKTHLSVTISISSTCLAIDSEWLCVCS